MPEILESEPLFLREWFEAGPLEVEIGCRRRKFLLDRAQANPGIRFLGIDRVAKWMKRSSQKVEKRQIGNLLFVKSEVREILFQIPPESTSVFHIYFPDPWLKRRHLRRRLLTPDFLVLLYRRLFAGGFVEMATDNADYFAQMKKSAEQTRLFWQSIRESGERLFEGMPTHYENKFTARGLPLYYLELQKIGRPS